MFTVSREDFEKTLTILWGRNLEPKKDWTTVALECHALYMLSTQLDFEKLDDVNEVFRLSDDLRLLTDLAFTLERSRNEYAI